MPTNINFDKKLGITGVTGISLPSSSTPSYQNEYSFQFDGVDDYIDTNSIYSELDGEKIATFSIWVKPTSIVQQIFLGLAHSTGTMSHLILYSSGLLRMTFANNGYYINANSGIITAGQWNHIMVCFDKNQTSSSLRGKIFVNGQDETSAVNLNNQSYPTANTALRIGAYPNGTNNANGLIDEVAIWVGTDLRDDVSTIYNGGLPNDLNDNGLTVPTTWFRMGEEATFDGIRDWDLVDQGTGGNDAVSQNIADSERVTDVPPNPFANTKSILLDGIDDYVTLGAMTGSSLAITGDVSISMWLKFTDSGGTRYAMSMGDGYGIYTSGGTINGFSRVGGTFTPLNGVGTFNDNAWHNVLYVKNSTNMLLYIDGVLNASNTNGGASVTTGLDMRLGARYTNANFYEGLMDEVAIWNSDQSANASVIGSTLPTDLSIYSPLSWWRCGDGDTAPTLTDNGSGGNDGTMTNFTTFSTDVPTFNTKSIELDGVDDYIDCGNNASLQITGALTLSAWIKTTDSSVYELIIGKDSISTGTRSYMLYKIGPKARFLIFNSSSYEYVESNFNVTDGNWHHIMGVNDGVDLKIYIDGNLDVTNVGGGGTILNGTSTFNIGRRASSPANRGYFTGNIDEVAVWNTDQSANISTIYNAGVPDSLSSLSPISWWRCGDGDTSPTLTDNGSGGNNGTMANFTTFSTDVPT